jgi:hypothetical protein
MGASGKEFLLMRQNEEGEIYVPSMKKKEIQLKAEQDVNELIDKGEVDIASVFADVSRVTEYITVFGKKLRENISESEYGNDYITKGAKISFRNTGDRLDYAKDEMYKELQGKLKAREELLKLAYKSKDAIFDHEGTKVMKVGIKTFGSNSVVLSY